MWWWGRFCSWLTLRGLRGDRLSTCDLHAPYLMTLGMEFSNYNMKFDLLYLGNLAK
jgi:hypothetical protein